MPMKPDFELYATVRVVAVRDDRFANAPVHFQRRPAPGDVGTILEVYTSPSLAYEVECSDAEGITVWLETLYPDEIEVVAKNVI